MSEWPRRIVLGALAAAAVVGGVALLLRLTGEPPEGPSEVAWDRTLCAECRMHVGDPAFAAQLHTKGGEVLHFDDPGCLVRWRDREGPDVHAVYYHHVHDERWLAEEGAAFMDVDRSPMGYGLGAVDRGTPGSIDVDEARERILGPPHRMAFDAEER